MKRQPRENEQQVRLDRFAIVDHNLQEHECWIYLDLIHDTPKSGKLNLRVRMSLAQFLDMRSQMNVATDQLVTRLVAKP